MASLLLCGAVSAQNYWGDDPNSHAQPSNTPIVASVTIGGDEVTASNDLRLGAFVGEELRGIAAQHTDGNFWIQVFYTDANDNITFKFYDGTDEYTSCETTLAGSEEGYGTPGAPQVLNFTTTQTMTQTSTLAGGWNWWSTPIEFGDNGLELLENALGNNGLSINSQNASVTNWYSTLGYDYWWGDPMTLQNEVGYRIKVTNDCSISLTGAPVNPENHEITLVPNWNWIGYPVRTEQNLSAALGSFIPSADDIIKGQGWTSSYWDGFGWWPDNCVLTPGDSYMYKSNASNNRTLVFSNSRSNNAASETREPLYWQNNAHNYADNLSIIAVVYINNEEQRNFDCEIGAFVNGESRGSARLAYFEPLDRWYAVLTISGQKDEEIGFNIVNRHNNQIISNSKEKVVFVSDAIYGSLRDPYSIHFGNTDMNLTIFPNPIEKGESFKLDIPVNEQVVKVMVTDAMGTIVLSETGTLDHTINGFNTPGVYILEVLTHSGNLYHGKLIVK